MFGMTESSELCKRGWKRQRSTGSCLSRLRAIYTPCHTSGVVVVFAEIYLQCWIVKTPTGPHYPQQNIQQVRSDRQDIFAGNIQENVQFPIRTVMTTSPWMVPERRRPKGGVKHQRFHQLHKSALRTAKRQLIFPDLMALETSALLSLLP